jgi:hypothetical protein
MMVREHRVYRMGYRYTYAWIGKKVWPIRISPQFMVEHGVDLSGGIQNMIGKTVQIGPYPLRIVKYEMFNLSVICYRTDVGFGIRPMLYLIWQRIYGAVMWVWWRIVATGKVWGIVPWWKRG